MPLGLPGHFSKPANSLTVHLRGDSVVPGCGQGAPKVSQEGFPKRVLFVGIAVCVAWEDLAVPHSLYRAPFMPSSLRAAL